MNVLVVEIWVVERAAPLARRVAMPAPVRIAVVGGGVAASSFVYGLRHALREGRASATLFEIGRGPGGRAATRTTREVSALRLDHGTPGFLTSAPSARALCDELCRIGALREATHGYGTLHADGSWEEELSVPHNGKRYVGGERGLSGASEAMLRGCEEAGDSDPLVDCRWGHVVREITPRLGGGWVLRGSAKEAPDGFAIEVDWLVSSTATIAHSRWTGTFGGPPPLAKAAEVMLAMSRAAVSGLSSQVGQVEGKHSSTNSTAVSEGAFELHEAVTHVNKLNVQPISAALMAFQGDAARAWAALPWSIARAEDWGDVGRIHVTRIHNDLTVSVVSLVMAGREDELDALSAWHEGTGPFGKAMGSW